MTESARGLTLRDNPDRKAFVYRHVVSFEETNLVGNVYFARHVAWQGRCREMFLSEHAPDIMKELKADLRLITLKVSCEYYEEVFALDEVCIHMYLTSVVSNRISLRFEYHVVRSEAVSQFAVGIHDLACMRTNGAGLRPTAIPHCLQTALQDFR